MTEQPSQPNQPYGQQPPPGYYAPPPKKKHTVRNVLLGLTLLFVLIVGGCIAVVGAAVDEVADEVGKTHEVVYKVGGTTKKADLTFTTDGSTSTSQEQGAKVPWEKTLSIKGEFGQVYQVMAQNTGKGTVTCEIVVDGKSVKTNESKGFAAIASCDYVP